MTDISLIIDVKGAGAVKQAAKDFLSAGTASKTLASKFDELAAKNIRVWKESKRLASLKKQLRKEIKAGTLESAKAAKMYREEIRLSKLAVLTDKTKIDQAKKAQRFRDAEVKKVVELRNKYKPLTVAAEEYRKVQAEIEQAMEDGVITADEYAVALDRVAKEFNDFKRGAATGGNQFAKFNVDSYRQLQKSKRFLSTGFQQAGYQVGDFIVQVQSGQSALVAFGQQGSQLAGIFGPAGAVVGALIAAGTAVAMILKNSRGAAKATNELKRAMEGLSEDLSKMKSYSDTLTELVSSPWFHGKEAMEEYFRTLESNSRDSATQKISNALGTTKQGLLGEEGIFGLGGEKNTGLLGRLKEELKKYETGTGRDVALETVRFQTADDIEKVLLLKKEMVVLAKALYDEESKLRTPLQMALNLRDLSNEAAFKSPIMQKELNALLAEGGILNGLLTDETSRRAEKTRELNKAVEDGKKIIEEAAKADIDREALQKEMLANAQASRDLARAGSQLDKDSLVLFQMRADEALRKYKIEVKSKKINFETKQELIRIKKQELESLRLNHIKKLELKEQNDLLKEQEQRIKNINLTPAQRRSGAGYQTLGEELSLRNATGLGPVDPKKDNKKSGSKSQAERDRENYEKYILQLKNGIRITKATAHMTKQNATIFEKLEKAKIKYAKTGVDFDEAEVKRYLTKQEQLNAYVKAVDDVRKRQEKLVDYMSSSFQTAMMSWVDHTKTFEEAFKQMASEIIKELYRILVVQSIVNAAKSYFGFEDGAVIQNGVKKFASGGIVSSPTMFPMASGRTGLMGEAGPEAIIPLSRGPNGKLGVQASGGGGTTINVVQNFSANGDESVRKLISKATPQITEAAKAAVLDSRKRGGNFRSTFS